jgi:hypothetical protein
MAAADRDLLFGLLARALAALAGPTLRPELANRAVALVRRALAGAVHDLDDLERDPALDTLRPRPDFALILLDLAFPAEPFAQSQ